MTTSSRSAGNISSLSQYLNDDLYEPWKREREQVLEPKWERNYNAFKCNSLEFWKAGETEDWRSKTFVPATKIKTITAYSIVIDMLLQTNRFPFALVESPYDNLVMGKLPEEFQRELEQDIQSMQSLIHQQLQDCNGDWELMRGTLSSAIYGEAFAKRYVKEVDRTSYKEVSFAPEGYEDIAGDFKRFEKEVIKVDSPAFSNVSVWSIVRDLEVDDPQDGVGIFFCDNISQYDLRLKMGTPYFIDANIESVIAESDAPGITHAQTDSELNIPRYRNLGHRSKTIEYKEFWGRIPLSVATDFENDMNNDENFVNAPSDQDSDGYEVEIMAVIADKEIVRYARMEETDTRPVYRMVWEQDIDGEGAIGVPDNVEDIQLVLNGAVRAFEDNKKLAANVILAMKKSLMPDWDGKIKPGINIDLSEEVKDARAAIQQIIITDVGESLLSLISLMERYADEASQIPRIQQGTQAEKQKVDTLGEMKILQANAGKYIGGVIKNVDNGWIEPIINDFFAFNMEDPSLKTGKGNFIAKSLGFSSFQDRVIRLQKLMQGINLALSDDRLAKEVKFRAALDDIFKAQDLDPDQLLKTEDEKQEEMQREMQAMAEQEAKIMEQRQMAMDESIAMKQAEAGIDVQADNAKEDNKTQNEIMMKAVEGGKK